MKLLPFELDWARTIARALVPAGALDGTVAAVDAGARVEIEVRRSPWYVAIAMRASLWLAWFAPVWLQLRPHSFGGVDEATREMLLEKLLKHRRYTVRMAATFLKLTLCMATLGDERVLRALAAYDLGATAARRAS